MAFEILLNDISQTIFPYKTLSYSFFNNQKLCNILLRFQVKIRFFIVFHSIDLNLKRGRFISMLAIKQTHLKNNDAIVYMLNYGSFTIIILFTQGT